MMATALEQQIQCSVCLGGFTDPVILPCEHLFCRQCILKHLQENKNPFREARCPDCRNTFRQEDLRDNRPVRNIVESVKEHLSELRLQQPLDQQQQKQQQQQDCSCNLCPEHEEKLKLFCETDQTLICLICRDSLQHRCHSFIAASDAASVKQDQVKAAKEQLSKDNEKVDHLIQSQLSEISKIKDRSSALSALITAQFEEMHDFLRKREYEEKKRLENETKHALRQMNQNLTRMEKLLSNGVDNEVILTSALEADQPDQFLQWWCENGNRIIIQVEQEHNGAARSPLKSLMKDLKVNSESLFRGSFDTELHVSRMVKEMMKAMRKVQGGERLCEESPHKLLLYKNC